MTVITDSVQTGRIYNQAGTREFAQCTAWVNFNGTGTVAIRDSLNVSSITDNGVGDYTVNFAQAMDNADYSMTGSVGASSGSAKSIQGDVYSNSSIRVLVIFASTSAGASDYPNTNIAIFGGIAL